MNRPLNMRAIWLIPVLFVIVAAASCKKYKCHTYGIAGVQINSGATIADTNAAVYMYTADGTFSNQLGAYSESVTGADDMKFVNFPVSGAEAWKYDWEVMLRPSGKTYKLKQFQAENDESIAQCVNPIHYLANDSALVSHAATLANMDTAKMYLLVYY
jgi:hypothetical protein